MRNVVTGFYVDVLRKLIDDGVVTRSDSVLVVCGGPLDDLVFSGHGFTELTITNLDASMTNNRQDAENLTFEDGSFDFVVVHAGLHHCYSPHRALLEMYRVARKCIIAFESRDSLLMTAAVRLGLTMNYEVDSVADGKGGVADTGIPNFIYRWTEREVFKTIATFNPTRHPNIRYFYEMRLPMQRIANKKYLRTIALFIEPLSKMLTRIAPKQCNEFAFVISKEGELHSWIK